MAYRLAAGALSGAVGAAAMAGASKLEQLATGRPDSFVQARTLAHLLRLPDPDRDGWARNMAMHYLAGVTAGALRGVMSASNLRGPFASLIHTNVRLAFDQTLENATAVRRLGRLASRRGADRPWRPLAGGSSRARRDGRTVGSRTVCLRLAIRR
jgi:hypothetical protein